MGGDHAPDEIVRGALLYREVGGPAEIVLVGDEARVRSALGGRTGDLERSTRMQGLRRPADGAGHRDAHDGGQPLAVVGAFPLKITALEGAPRGWWSRRGDGPVTGGRDDAARSSPMGHRRGGVMLEYPTGTVLGGAA